MPHEDQTERAATDIAPSGGAMSTKEKIEAVNTILGRILSWPVLALAIVFILREELPGMADRLEKIRIAGLEADLATINETLATNTEKLQTVAEQVDTIQKHLVEFRSSPELTEALQATLEAKLSGFSTYLTAVGFHLPPGPVAVKVGSSGTVTRYYPEENLISISVDLASYPDEATRWFAVYATSSVAATSGLSSASKEIHDALSYYYPASYTDDPNVWPLNLSASNVWEEFFHGATPVSNPYWEEMSSWAGAFWDMRQRLGQDRTDRALLAAWSANTQPGLDQLEPADFVQRILDAFAADGGPDVSDQVRAIFAQRGIPLPG